MYHVCSCGRTVTSTQCSVVFLHRQWPILYACSTDVVSIIFLHAGYLLLMVIRHRYYVCSSRQLWCSFSVKFVSYESQRVSACFACHTHHLQHDQPADTSRWTILFRRFVNHHRSVRFRRVHLLFRGGSAFEELIPVQTCHTGPLFWEGSVAPTAATPVRVLGVRSPEKQGVRILGPGVSIPLRYSTHSPPRSHLF